MDAVDPLKIPQKLTHVQLQDWCLFGVLVANKEATQTRHKLDLLLGSLRMEYPKALTPFDAVRAAVEADTLMTYLKTIRTGQYRRIERAFRELIEIDLDNISVEALESVHGIGPKTARMIALYHLPDLDVVPLDTHVLKYLRSVGHEDAPKSTPSPGKQYQRWEQAFVAEAKKAGMTVRDFDTKVWQMYAKSLNGTRG